MSILELKQGISRLSYRDRRELQLYLLRLQRQSPTWKRATARKIREMQAGKFVTVAALRAKTQAR